MTGFARDKKEREWVQKQLIRTQNIYSVEVNQTMKPIWMMPALIGLRKKECAALITDMARNDFEKQGGVDRPVCSTGSMESCRPVLGSERFDVPSREYSTLREPCDHLSFEKTLHQIKLVTSPCSEDQGSKLRGRSDKPILIPILEYVNSHHNSES